MRKTVTIALTTLTLLGLLAPPAAAARNPKPRVEILDVAYDPDWDEHVFEIEAHDPDGIITEVVVQFGDRSISFAHTYCVIFGPGEVAKMRIGHRYAQDGRFTVRAWAVSVPECSEWGFDHHQESRPDVERFAIDVP